MIVDPDHLYDFAEREPVQLTAENNRPREDELLHLPFLARDIRVFHHQIRPYPRWSQKEPAAGRADEAIIGKNEEKITKFPQGWGNWIV